MTLTELLPPNQSLAIYPADIALNKEYTFSIRGNIGDSNYHVSNELKLRVGCGPFIDITEPSDLSRVNQYSIRQKQSDYQTYKISGFSTSSPTTCQISEFEIVGGPFVLKDNEIEMSQS